MIFKIVRNSVIGEGQTKTISCENYVWEANFGKYRKVRVMSLQEFEERMKERISKDAHFISYPQSIEFEGGHGIEYIEIQLETTKNEFQYVICNAGQLYVMNNQGKTIDSVKPSIIFA